MTLDFELNRKDYIDFNVYNLDNSATIKKSLLVARVLLSVIILIVGLSVVKRGNIIGYIYFTVIWLLMMIFFPKGFRSHVKKELKRC